MGENVERWKIDFWPSDYMICRLYIYNGVIFKFDVYTLASDHALAALLLILNQRALRYYTTGKKLKIITYDVKSGILPGIIAGLLRRSWKEK